MKLFFRSEEFHRELKPRLSQQETLKEVLRAGHVMQKVNLLIHTGIPYQSDDFSLK